MALSEIDFMDENKRGYDLPPDSLVLNWAKVIGKAISLSLKPRYFKYCGWYSKVEKPKFWWFVAKETVLYQIIVVSISW